MQTYGCPIIGKAQAVGDWEVECVVAGLHLDNKSGKYLHDILFDVEVFLCTLKDPKSVLELVNGSFVVSNEAPEANK